MGKARIPTDAEIEAARECGAADAKYGIRAAKVEYMRGIGAGSASRIWLTLTTGSVLVFDADSIPELAGAQADDLEMLTVMPGGSTIECEPLDVHLSAEALAYQALLGDVWPDALRRKVASLHGSRNTAAKAAAARENGKKGGRPRKVEHPHSRLPVNVQRQLVLKARAEAFKRHPAMKRTCKGMTTSFDSTGGLILNVDHGAGKVDVLNFDVDQVKAWMPKEMDRQDSGSTNESAAG